MNKTFAEYATSTAFALTLSKNHCHILLRIRRSVDRDHYMFHPHQARQLRIRGLIEAIPDKQREKLLAGGQKSCIYRLTKAGELVCQLLDEAGLTLANTTTLTIVKAENFWSKTPSGRHGIAA